LNRYTNKDRLHLLDLVSLVVKLEGSNEGPRQIDDPEKFKNTPFDDLWTEATTPRYKLDRSYGDNLQDNQYK
jgi:hypothetical protein